MTHVATKTCAAIDSRHHGFTETTKSKPTMNSSKELFLATAVAVAALTACGGGGGGGSIDTGPVVTPPAAEGNLVMTMPGSPYLVGSAEKRNFDEINRIRIGGGFGAAVYDEVMSKAAKAHDDYLATNFQLNNPIPDAHAETAGFPGFTGATPQDRCVTAAVGTDGAGKMLCGENLFGNSFPGVTLENVNAMANFGMSTGHLQNQLNVWNNRMGLRVKADPAPLTGVSGTIVVGTRVGADATLPGSKANGIVGVYPFDGMTGVGVGVGCIRALGGCNPDSGLGTQMQDGQADVMQSTSILVQASNGQNPVLTSFTLRKEGATVDTPTEVHTAGTPHGPEPTLAGWSILYSKTWLEKNTKYIVTYVATIGGVPVSKTWSFTTGTSNYSRMGG